VSAAAPELQLPLQPLRIGEVQTVSFEGKNLAERGELWASFPVAAAECKEGEQRGQPVRFTLFIPDSVRPGIGALRLRGETGVSQVRWTLLDDLPVLQAADGRHSTNEAMGILPPLAVQAICRERAVDYYAVELEAGQLLSVETVAARIGSAMDSILRVLDGSGQELAYNDDVPAWGRDSKLVFTAPDQGRYYLEVRDTYYQGGANTFYFLRVAHGELAPLIVLEDEIPEAFKTLQPAKPKRLEASAPNEALERATPVCFPAILSGSFRQKNQKEFFSFQIQAEERLSFQGRTRSIGSPCDLVFHILDSEGKVLAESNPASGEGRIDHRFPEAGGYFIQLSELTGKSGEGLFYELEASPFTAGFDLELDSDRINLVPGEEVELKISVSRRDYEGAIEIFFAFSEGGLCLVEDIIPEKKNEGVIRLKVPADAQPGDGGQFALAGRIPEDQESEQGFFSGVKTSAVIRRAFPQWLYPPQAMNGLLAFAVIAPEENED
jgi:hypothetical protein